jgi:double zinc ribbon protein
MGQMAGDWYAYLRLGREATTGEITSAVERLSRQASALAATAPERSQSLREAIRAIKHDLLSGPENRQRYDARLRETAHSGRNPAPAAPAGSAAASTAPGSVRAGQGTGARLARFLRTGWTCPSCGRGAVPSDKFCTKCGTPIRPVHPDGSAGHDRAARPRPVCPTCANLLGPLDGFCSKCGTPRQSG